MLPFPEMPLDEHQVLLYLFEGISFQTLQAEKKMGIGRELGLNYASEWQCLSESPGARLAASFISIRGAMSCRLG